MGGYIHIYIYTGPTTGVFKFFGNMDLFVQGSSNLCSPTTIMPDFVSLWHCSKLIGSMEAF